MSTTRFQRSISLPQWGKLAAQKPAKPKYASAPTSPASANPLPAKTSRGTTPSQPLKQSAFAVFAKPTQPQNEKQTSAFGFCKSTNTTKLPPSVGQCGMKKTAYGKFPTGMGAGSGNMCAYRAYASDRKDKGFKGKKRNM